MQPSQTDDWATPLELFEQLDAKYNFKLDAAASSYNHLCANWFGLDHPDPLKRNGLTAEWNDYGKVWCNPPYGRGIADWVNKAFQCNNQVVMLLPARTDTRWFHDLLDYGSQITFIKGRLKLQQCQNCCSISIHDCGHLTQHARTKGEKYGSDQDF